MRHAPIDPRLFVENRARLAESLRPGSVAILHSADVPPICSDGTMRFIQNSDLFYLTGAAQEETVLVIWPDAPDPAQREILFVRESSELIAIWEGHKLTKEGATAISGIANVQWTDAFEPTLRRIARQVETIYLNANEHPRADTLVASRDDRWRKRCQLLYPRHRYERLAPLLTAQRQQKSDIEIGLLRQACEITGKGFRRLLAVTRPGLKEYELEAELLHEFVRHGSRGFSYEPIIAGGANACILHYLDNDGTLRDGDLVLLDIGAEYARYNADLTRTIPVSGRFSPRQRAVYEAVHRIYRACIDTLIRPGVAMRATYERQVARLVEDELISLGLLEAAKVAEERLDENKPETGRLYRKWFMHGTSHNLGLDVHDVTPPDAVFVEDMVVTVEPGIYLREEGFGIRLETNIVVRSSGNIDLMENVPIAADEIEALMAQKML